MLESADDWRKIIGVKSLRHDSIVAITSDMGWKTRDGFQDRPGVLWIPFLEGRRWFCNLEYLKPYMGLVAVKIDHSSFEQIRQRLYDIFFSFSCVLAIVLPPCHKPA